MAREEVPYGTRICPKDGGRLSQLLRLGDLSVSSGGLFGSEKSSSFLQCMTCNTEYDEAVPFTFVGGGALGSLGRIGGLDQIFGSTSRELEDAGSKTKELLVRLEKLEDQFADKVQELETSTSNDAGLRDELDSVRHEIEGVDERIERAKKSFAELLPDAADIAYLKIVKLHITEVEHVVGKHIEDDHRRQTTRVARGASARSWIAIAIAGAGLIVAILRSGIVP